MDENRYGSAFAVALPFEKGFSCNVRHIPVKRIFDILFSLAAIIAALPLFAIIYILIKSTSKGKVIYSQERIGRGGSPFRCLKFRTMHQDADKRLQKLLDNDPSLKKEWQEKKKIKEDPRITFFGSFLRRSSLDELPQFWNVLKGDMSIVGPRPVILSELYEHFAGKASVVLSVRPGLTGLWQVSGRSNTTYIDRVNLDEKYVKTQNLWLDIRLILQTIPSIFFSRGAY